MVAVLEPAEGQLEGTWGLRRNVGTERQQSLGSSSHSLKHLHGRGSSNRCCGGKPEIPACERLGGEGSPRPSACGSTGSVGLSEDLGAETV